MGDLPEPKQERVSAIADPIQRNLGQRQARRLSNLVGLDQVKKSKHHNKNLSDVQSIPAEISIILLVWN